MTRDYLIFHVILAVSARVKLNRDALKHLPRQCRNGGRVNRNPAASGKMSNILDITKIIERTNEIYGKVTIFFDAQVD